MDCLICKLIKGEIPAHKIYEDEDFFAFLDINPSAPGHTVVVPKKHVSTIFELDENDLGKLFKKVAEIAMHIKDSTLPATGFNIGVNHWKTAGQQIEHLHVHIIPRVAGDGGGAIQSIVANKSDESLESICDKIKIN